MFKPTYFLIILFLIILAVEPYCQTVYVTKTGKKYHLSNCSSLSSSSKEIELSEAIDKGYTPCKRCNPPTNTNANSDNSKNNKLGFSEPTKTNNNSNTTKQCIAFTKKGKQCSRNAEEGSDYCWQHNKTKSDNKNTNDTYKSGSTGKTIYTGPRGGQYYINKNGKKTYIKKNK